VQCGRPTDMTWGRGVVDANELLVIWTGALQSLTFIWRCAGTFLLPQITSPNGGTTQCVGHFKDELVSTDELRQQLWARLAATTTVDDLAAGFRMISRGPPLREVSYLSTITFLQCSRSLFPNPS
jgi:hypothetical protein